MSQVWIWGVQTGYLCPTTVSTTFEFPFSLICCLVTIVDRNVGVEINMQLTKKGCKPIQKSKNLLLKLFRVRDICR